MHEVVHSLVTDFHQKEDENGNIKTILRMCVTSERRVQLYHWKEREFVKIRMM